MTQGWAAKLEGVLPNLNLTNEPTLVDFSASVDVGVVMETEGFCACFLLACSLDVR